MQTWNEITRSYSVWDDKQIKGFFGNNEYRFLSNFWTTSVYLDGFQFNHVEGAYHFAKYLYGKISVGSKSDCSLNETYEKVWAMTPRESKNWGNDPKQVILPENWQEIKYDVMLGLVFSKFFQNKELREKLLATGDKYLEESCHWHDNFWGVCTCRRCDSTTIGQNNLGKILMKVRECLRPTKD